MIKPNEITLEKKSGITLFKIEGDVTTHSEPFFNEAYTRANNQNTRKIIFWFKEDAYINSGGIAVLIQILAETQTNKQHTGITGLSEHFKKIFNMVGITKFAEIYPTIDDALKAMTEST